MIYRSPSMDRAGVTFETDRDDEIAQWLKHGYVEQVKASRRKATKKK